MARDTIICGLDIGSSKTRTAIALTKEEANSFRLLAQARFLQWARGKGPSPITQEAAARVKESIKWHSMPANIWCVWYTQAYQAACFFAVFKSGSFWFLVSGRRNIGR